MARYLYTLEIAFNSFNKSQVLSNSQDAPYCWGFTRQIDNNQEEPYHNNKLSFKNDSGDTYQFRLRIGDIGQLYPYAVITNLWLTFASKNATTPPKTTPFSGTPQPPLIYDFNNGNAKGTKQTLLSMNQPDKNCWLIGDSQSDLLKTPWTFQNQGSWEFSVWFCVQLDPNNAYQISLYKVDPEVDIEGAG